jgi:hypothetical protein
MASMGERQTDSAIPYHRAWGEEGVEKTTV